MSAPLFVSERLKPEIILRSSILILFSNIDGKAENRGSKTWQLVKAVDGWCIAAISYSSDPAVQQWRLENKFGSEVRSKISILFRSEA